MTTSKNLRSGHRTTSGCCCWHPYRSWWLSPARSGHRGYCGQKGMWFRFVAGCYGKCCCKEYGCFFIILGGLKLNEIPDQVGNDERNGSGMTATRCLRFLRCFQFLNLSTRLLLNKVPALQWPEIDTVFLPYNLLPPPALERLMIKMPSEATCRMTELNRVGGIRNSKSQQV